MWETRANDYASSDKPEECSEGEVKMLTSASALQWWSAVFNLFSFWV